MKELIHAAYALYMAGRWTCGLPADQEAAMWERLREALDLPAGTATAAGMGSPE